MNYLAHLLLAEDSDDARLGALLGDFMAGGRPLDASPTVWREIRVHRRIDSYTDAHPILQPLRAHFPQGRRRYAGIALDVYFDHLLARDWPQHHARPLSDFAAEVYALLMHRLPELPSRLQAIAPQMAAQDWLGSYRHRSSVDQALQRIAGRLTRGEGLVACLPLLSAHEAEIEAAFGRFLPELREFVVSERARLRVDAWEIPP